MAEKDQGYAHLEHKTYNGKHKYKGQGLKDIDPAKDNGDIVQPPVPATKRRRRGW